MQTQQPKNNSTNTTVQKKQEDLQKKKQDSKNQSTNPFEAAFESTTSTNPDPF